MLECRPTTRRRRSRGGLAKVQATLKKGNHASGLKSLTRLLEQHAEQSYVRARRSEITDLAERLAFGAACPAPDPATVIEGKILKYDPKSGKIEIEYTPKTSLHLERVESLRYFPTRGRTVLSVSSAPTTWGRPSSC